MKLSVVNPNYAQGWMEVHKAGCQHLNSRKPVHWTFEAATVEEAAEEIAGDFIAEGSMSVVEAIDYITWAPCTRELRSESVPS